MTRAHVALGSNLGDRLATLDAAVRALDADDHTHVMAVSQVYETEPDGGPGQGPYLNAVAVLETDRDPRSLLDLLLLTEERLGRVRHEHWGPRTADLDQIGRAHVELQSRPHLVCRLLLEKKKKHDT